jgi:hypothetical protein
MVENYGWRGALLIHAGFVMHIIIVSSFYIIPNIPELQKNNDSDTPETTKKKDSNCFEFMKNFFKTTWNFALFKNTSFVLLFVGSIISFPALDVMYKFSPIRAISKGVPAMDASFLPSVIGIAAMIGRLLTSAIVYFPCVNLILFCGTGILLSGMFCIASCFAWNYISLVVITAGYGFFMGKYTIWNCR